MSKALVLMLANGTAIKWAGKYHNHLAFVDPANGRIKEFLPVRIWNSYVDPSKFNLEVEGVTLPSTHASHRAALQFIATHGIVLSEKDIKVGGEEIAGRDWAEDMNLSQFNSKLPAARGANAGVTA